MILSVGLLAGSDFYIAAAAALVLSYEPLLMAPRGTKAQLGFCGDL